MSAKGGGSAIRLSAWQRYALLVVAVGVIYTCVAVFLYKDRRAAGKSRAPGLQFGGAGADAQQSTRHMQSPARKTPWVETVSGTNVGEPRIFVIHDLLGDSECEHLIALALKRGLKSSLITPYGSHDLVESTTRTNKQAWLEFGEDAIVKGIEERIARITKTYPEQGENLQVPHATRSGVRVVWCTCAFLPCSGSSYARSTQNVGYMSTVMCAVCALQGSRVLCLLLGSSH